MSKLACNSVNLLVILVLWIVANANIRQQDELQVFRKVQESSTKIKQILRFYSLNNIRTKVLRKIKP